MKREKTFKEKMQEYGVVALTCFCVLLIIALIVGGIAWEIGKGIAIWKFIFG